MSWADAFITGIWMPSVREQIACVNLGLTETCKQST